MSGVTGSAGCSACVGPGGGFASAGSGVGQAEGEGVWGVCLAREVERDLGGLCWSCKDDVMVDLEEVGVGRRRGGEE